MLLTDWLQNEHRTIEKMLDCLQTLCERIEQQQPVEGSDLLACCSWIGDYADKRHHGHEEQLLFPAMSAAGLPRDGGPIAVMLYEHEQGRVALASMRAAAEASSPSDFLPPARSYLTLLRQHILKEDRVLYPMAVAMVGRAQLEALTASTATTGQEELLEILEELCHRYG